MSYNKDKRLYWVIFMQKIKLFIKKVCQFKKLIVTYIKKIIMQFYCKTNTFVQYVRNANILEITMQLERSYASFI